MATNFPGSLDAFTNPTSGDTLDNPPHDQQHADVNDAVEALQAKVGVDGSAVTSSLDYKVENLITGALGGKVLQVVNSIYSTSTSVSGSTYVTTGLEATISASSATSKILVMFSHSAQISAGGFLYWALQLNTVTQVTDGDVLYDPSYQVESYITFHNVLTPATTSPQTWRTVFRCPSGTATFQPNNTISSMTLMEIAG